MRGIFYFTWYHKNIMTWAGQRQLMYLSIVILFVFGGLFLVIYPRLNVPPTCSDGKQNGVETGVDCGGMCAKFCQGDKKPITVLWARTFEIIPGVYHAVAYLENQNTDAGVAQVPYKFRVYDADNKLIISREGTTFISPNGHMAVFEESLPIGVNRIPKFTRFEFTQDPVFYKTPSSFDDIKLVQTAKSLTDLDTIPKASVTLKNDSFVDTPQFPVIAIVYDATDNAIAVSKTFADAMPKNTEETLYFSWPHPFDRASDHVEVVPIINAFTVGTTGL